MNQLVLTLAILASVAAADNDTTAAADDTAVTQAAEVRAWDFERCNDANYDDWPDQWTRRRGRGYPVYLHAGIVPPVAADQESANHCLRLELDGGAVQVASPPVEISSLFSYLLTGRVRTEGLRHDVASCRLSFLNQDGRVVDQHESELFRQDTPWTSFQIGPITIRDPAVVAAQITLHLRPTDRADITGAAMFDDLWFGKLPRVSLETTTGSMFFTEPRRVEFRCRVSGFLDPGAQVEFELSDVDQQTVARQRTGLTLDEPQRGVRQASYSGVATWRPPTLGNGFYEVRATIPGTKMRRYLRFVVMSPNTPRKKGEFGWSVPGGDQSVPLKELATLLGTVGIHWVKFPVWYGDDEVGRADQLAWFAERLGSQNIQLIGMLDQPPVAFRDLFGDRGDLPVASIFVEPKVWYPAVDPVLTRLSLKVRWWQLGNDQDTSFVNFPNLEEALGQIRHDFNRFGQEINLGVSWRSVDETPAAANPPWSFLSFTADPPLTVQELHDYLRQDENRNALRWVVVRPLPRKEYDLHTRASDLVSRMIAAKMEGADGIFIPDPFDPAAGLLHADGSPTEMLLPWRTAAETISGAEYLGSLQLPGGSPNHVFGRDDQAVMVVWNDQPTTETLYLGDAVRQVDLWGRITQPAQVVAEGGHEQQTIQVGRLPIFVTGLNLPVAKWRLGFEFQTKRLASVFGREQNVLYRFQNTFPQAIGGAVTLQVPDVWEADPKQKRIKLSPGEQTREGAYILLHTDANSGEQPVRVDFEITADKLYRFSVYRSLHVGLGDVLVELDSRLDDDGNLVLEQHLINTTDRFVSFNCMLFVPGRRRERRQVFHLGRGRTTNVFVLENGAELVGQQLWIRAEEVDGARVLNHHFIVHE